MGQVVSASVATAKVTDVYGYGLFQVFTSSGTFVVPDGVTKVRARVTGGGGGGGATGGGSYKAMGGGGGGFAIGEYSVTPGASITVTVGAGGAGATASGTGNYVNGSAGGTSSFGAFCSATGGEGGKAAITTNPLASLGGIGSGGALNFSGGKSYTGAGGGTPGGGAAGSILGNGGNSGAATGCYAAGGGGVGSNHGGNQGGGGGGVASPGGDGTSSPVLGGFGGYNIQAARVASPVAASGDVTAPNGAESQISNLRFITEKYLGGGGAGVRSSGTANLTGGNGGTGGGGGGAYTSAGTARGGDGGISGGGGGCANQNSSNGYGGAGGLAGGGGGGGYSNGGTAYGGRGGDGLVIVEW